LLVATIPKVKGMNEIKAVVEILITIVNRRTQLMLMREKIKLSRILTEGIP
jgi:hypothetical protein